MVVLFDQYQRYKHVEEVVELIREEKSYKILEVGANEHKNLEKFLPNDYITYLDIEVPKSLQNDPQYIVADATNMPQIHSESYDFVVALDVFEHIPNESREAFLSELHRVAKHGVIISAPHNSSAVINAEMRANAFYKQLYGSDFRWLQEHRENDLPDIAETVSFFKKNNIEFVQFEHASLTIWEKLLDIVFLFADKIEYQDQRILLDAYYNEFVYPYDFGNDNYRVFFISSKVGKVDKINTWINNRIKNSKSEEALKNIEHLNWLEEHIKHTYLTKKLSEITMQNNQVSALENTISQNQIELSNTLNNIKSDINQTILTVKNELVEYGKELQIELDQKYKIKNEISATNIKLIEENLELKNQIELKENHIRNIESYNNSIVSTKGWRALEKFRRIKLFFKRNRSTAIPKVINKVKNEGLKSTLQTIEQKISNELQEETYHEWYLKRQPTENQIQEMKSQIKEFQKKPLISVVMPTYNTPSKLLNEAIQSLKNQIYPNWELCICDDCSTNEKVWKELQQYADEDNRIKIIRSSENSHISGATNLAISLATGEYVGFLDHDDLLTVDALYEIVKVINESEPDLIYSDEDKLELDGTFSDPFFKPDWSPDYLLSVNYICHFAVYKKIIGDEIGWLRNGCEGSQDHDLLLRFTEKTNKISHVPKILYHWRKIANSTSSGGDAKSYAWDNGVKAIQDALDRRGIIGTVSKGKSFGHYIVSRKILEEKMVSIIIPIRDKLELLKTCIDSIEKKTTYKNYEIIIIDNGSVEEKTLKYLKNSKHTVLRLDMAFNYSKLNNEAVKIANGEYILFLNNDMEVISPEWLSVMVEHIQRPEVGAVGAKLYYTNNQIQHAGIIMGIGGVAGHSHKYFPRESKGYLSTLIDTRNYSGVTAACLLTRKSIFEEVGGFNEENLAVAFNDVDLCLKIRELNYLIVLDPRAELYHHESVSRGHSLNKNEIDYMKSTWSNSLYKDPYYNINLTLEHENYSLKY